MTQSELETLIAENQTEKAMDILMDMLKGHERPELLRTVIMQKARFIQHRELQINNMLSSNDFWQVRSEIHNALLEVINQIGKNPLPAENSAEGVAKAGADAPKTGYDKIHVEGSNNVVIGAGNIHTGGGDFIIGGK